MMKKVMTIMFLTAANIYAALPVTDGLVCRLDAASVTKSGDKVSQMTDLSGQANHAVQASDDNKPVLAYNSGLPLVYFSDTAKSLVVTHSATLDTDPNSSLTVFVAAMRSGELATGTYPILNKGNSTWNTYNSGNVGWSMWFWKATSGILNRVTFQACSTYPTYTSTYSGAAAYDSVDIDDFFVASTVININGLDKTVTLESDPAVTGGATSKGLIFRDSINTTSNLVISSDGLYIGEILIYNRSLTPEEILSVRAYMDEKYVLIPDYNCEYVWQNGLGDPTDFNQDCYVNFEDFAYFAEKWLFCNNPEDINCQQPQF